jgi:hypothetical protein
MREIRKAYVILLRKPEGKRVFGRPSSSFENNIKMDLNI